MSSKINNYYNNGIFEMVQKDNYTQIRSLLSEEDIKRAIVRAKEKMPVIKDELLNKIQSLITDLKKINPFILIYQMALMELFSNRNIYSESKMDSDMVYLGYSVMYLQSIMASNAELDYTKDISENQMYDILNKIKELLKMYQEFYIGIKYMAQSNCLIDEDTNLLKMYLELLNHVTGDRYQCFHKQYFDILLPEQNNLIYEKYGINANELINGLEDYNKFLSTGLNNAINLTFKSFEDFQIHQYENMEEFRKSIENIDELSKAFDTMFGPRLFNFGEISKFPTKLLDDLSFNIGEEKEFGASPEPYFPDKVFPINKRPLIKIGNSYYSFWSRTLYDKFYRVLYRIVTEKDETKKQTWNNNQKLATEIKIPKLISEKFKFTNFYTNNYYDFVENGNKKRTENDAIILFENKILIVEIKAGAISNSSISNDFKSFENNFTDIFDKGIIQGERLINLISSQEIIIYDEDGNVKLKIPKTESKNIFVINVTIDDLNEITAHFEDTKYATYSNTHNCICISLSDLLVYLDYFEDRITFFHFLSKRCKSMITKKIMLNDELDHLGLYIEYNDYTMYSSTLESERIDWNGYRSKIDEYYCKKYNSSDAIKPKQNLPARIIEIIDFLNKNYQYYNNSIDIACMILDLSFDTKEELNARIEFLIRSKDEKILFMKGEEINYSFIVKTEKFLDMKEIDKHIYATMIPTREKSRSLFIMEYKFGNLINLKYKEYFLSDLSQDEYKDCNKLKDIIIGKRISKNKVGRNDPCPCGSGKKYKKCCGRNY